mmetsp:Transcript_12857/g.30153  ORF Transcript_12857/g.30153 Transcript_12857/m.30153 type:complete len:219 (-) Transcript_12857:1619-2275(-)
MMSGADGATGNTSTLPSRRWMVPSGTPITAVSARSAAELSACAWRRSIRAVEAATRARVSSVGDTFPAVTRRAAASTPLPAIRSDSSATLTRSWAVSASKKAWTAVARMSARRAIRSSAAMSLPRCASSTRAARLPPVSSVWLSCIVVTRVPDLRSSWSTPSTGFGMRPAWRTVPSLASSSAAAARSWGFCASAVSTAVLKDNGVVCGATVGVAGTVA